MALLRKERSALAARADAAAQRLKDEPAPGLNAEPRTPSRARPHRRHRGLRAIPYVILAAVGAGYGLQTSLLAGSRAEAAAAPRYRPLPPEIPLAEPNALPSVAGERIAEPELDASGEALRLVYESKAPGSQASVLELLGSSEAPAARSPWEVDRFDESGYVVTYRGPDGAAAYEFETDTAAGLVRPSAETARRLAALALTR